MERPVVRLSLVSGLVAALGVIIGYPAGNALACSTPWPRSVRVDDLPAVLDNPETVIQLGELDPDGTVPQVTGAARVEVVEVTPETDAYLAGWLEQQTHVWGDAKITPIYGQAPKLQSEATMCDGYEPDLGTSSYYLSTEDGDAVNIETGGGQDDADVAAALDQLFGPSALVTDEMAEAATPGGRPDISRPEGILGTVTAPTGSTLLRGAVIMGVIVVAVIVVAVIVAGRRTRRRSGPSL